MGLDLGTRTFLTLMSDDSTPESLLGYHGFLIGLTPADVAALPTGIDTLTVAGIVIPGYRRTPAGGGLEWVMTPLPDPNVAMLEGLPRRPGGWVNASAKGVWASVGLALLDKGLPGSDLRVGFPLLFDAAKAEILAEQA